MKTSWQEIFGKDADLLAYSQHRGHVIPVMQESSDFLDDYVCSPDPEYPEHRDHLSHAEKWWLASLMSWRFGMKTYLMPFPSLSWWANKLHISRKHMIKMYRFLVHQALLLMPENHKQGRRLCFGVDALLEKIREWLRDRKEIAPVVEVSQPEQETYCGYCGKDSWSCDCPRPSRVPYPAASGPEEEEEEEEEPIAAMVAAPEWDMALPGIKQEVGASAFINLFGIRAYWIEGRLTLKVRDRAQWNLIDARFKRVIQRHLAGYDVVIPCPARSA